MPLSLVRKLVVLALGVFFLTHLFSHLICCKANTLRGSEEGKRELYGGTNRSGGYGYRHPYRFIGRRGGCKPDLYLVEDDSERSTKKCTDNLRDEFWREVNSVKTVHTAIGARYGDLIYYVNQATNCGDVWWVSSSDCLEVLSLIVL